MTKIAIQIKLNKIAQEIEKLMGRSKRKLLELEVLMSFKEIKSGAFDVFDSAKDLIKKVK